MDVGMSVFSTFVASLVCFLLLELNYKGKSHSTGFHVCVSNLLGARTF